MLKFYKCETCGNITVKLVDSKVPVMCCGKPMAELIPGTSDGAAEKHVPVATVEGNKVSVQVGSVEHPMVEEHFITFVVLETCKGFQLKNLSPSEKPVAEFVLAEGECPKAVYEYCNLHGLWKAEL